MGLDEKSLKNTVLKKSPLYSIQLDESTDIAGLTQLFVFIRYINNATISEDFLFCKALKLHTKGEDICSMPQQLLFRVFNSMG